MKKADESANAPSLFMRRCTLQDLSLLQAFSRKTYFDTFAAMNTEENMNAYLNSAYDLDVLGKELRNPNSYFFFLYADGQLAGYLKLNENDAQTDLYDPDALEIERIYVDKAYQRRGYGHFLMEYAITIAATRNKEYVWLGVWEKNERALQFYERHGFYEIGTHSFTMGDDVQTDYVMRKILQSRTLS